MHGSIFEDGESDRTVAACTADASIPSSRGPTTIPHGNTSSGGSRSAFTHSGLKPDGSLQFGGIEPLDRCANRSLSDPGGYFITAQLFYRVIYDKRLDWEYFQCNLERDFLKEADAFKEDLKFTTRQWGVVRIYMSTFRRALFHMYHNGCPTVQWAHGLRRSPTTVTHQDLEAAFQKVQPLLRLLPVELDLGIDRRAG